MLESKQVSLFSLRLHLIPYNISLPPFGANDLYLLLPWDLCGGTIRTLDRHVPVHFLQIRRRMRKLHPGLYRT